MAEALNDKIVGDSGAPYPTGAERRASPGFDACHPRWRALAGTVGGQLRLPLRPLNGSASQATRRTSVALARARSDGLGSWPSAHIAAIPALGRPKAPS
jgi:hypothetical protein